MTSNDSQASEPFLGLSLRLAISVQQLREFGNCPARGACQHLNVGSVGRRRRRSGSTELRAFRSSRRTAPSAMKRAAAVRERRSWSARNRSRRSARGTATEKRVTGGSDTGG